MTARNCCRCFTASLVPLAALVLAIVFAVGIVVLPVLYVHLARNVKYAIVIDAGSSHTTMHFYKWYLPKDAGTAKIREMNTCMTHEILSNYSRDPSLSGEVFSDCISSSHHYKYIPPRGWDHTNLYLGATAGMRLVERDNATISEAIMTAANAELKKNSSYQFVSGRIITGSEEAASGWIAANFAQKSLMKSARFTTLPLHYIEDQLMGSLDLGGASAEIAFLFPTGSDPTYRVTVDLFGETHSLYSRSYLCFGENEAKWRLLAYLINSTDAGDKAIQNPCMQGQARMNYSGEDIFSSLCVKEDTSSEIFGFGYAPPSEVAGDGTTNYTFVGTGNPEHCHNIIATVFNVTNCSDVSICKHSQPQFHWPPVNNSGAFFGMSGFYYTADFFNTSGVNLTSLQNFSSSVTKFCQLNQTQRALVYSGYGDKYLQDRCFSGIYSLFLLETGFGFNSSTSNWTLRFVEKVEGVSVTWATGYMLNQSKNISDDPHYMDRPYSAVDLIVGILVLTILCSVFVLFFLLTFNACRKVLRSHTGYSQIS